MKYAPSPMVQNSRVWLWNKITAIEHAVKTANMRFFKLGRDEVVIGIATMDDSTDKHLFLSPQKYSRRFGKVLSLDQLSRESVFLSYRSSKDLEPIRNLVNKAYNEAIDEELKDFREELRERELEDAVGCIAERGNNG